MTIPMNGAFLHVASNHVPVVGMPLLAALLLWGLVRRSQDVIRASLGGFVLIAAVTVFAFKTGGPAARILRQYPDIARGQIHAHAQAAETGLIASELLGALSLAGLFFYRRKEIPGALSGILLGGALACSLWLGWVAHLGGLVRHPEIEGTGTPPAVVEGAPPH